MAERLKEFINDTLTGVDIIEGDKIQLVSNNTTTQAIVTDVLIESNIVKADESVASLKTYNGQTKIFDKLLSATGKELIETSNSLFVELDEKLDAKKLIFVNTGDTNIFIPLTTSLISVYKNTAAYIETDSAYALLNNGEDASLRAFGSEATTLDNKIAPENSGVTNAFANYPQWIYESSNGNQYYFKTDGNSATVFYRAQTYWGSYTSVNSGNYSYSALDMDKEEVFYVKGGTKDLYSYDLNTQVETLLATMPLPANTSTYSSTASCGDLFLIVVSSSYLTNLYYYRHSTGEMGEIAVNSDLNATTGFAHISLAYNEDEDKYYILSGAHRDRKMYALDATFIGNTTATYFGSVLSVFPDSTIDSATGNMQGTSNSEFTTWHNTGCHVIKMENNLAKIDKTFKTSATPTNEFGWVYNSKKQVATTLPIDFNINLKCKVSGVEITEVGV